MNRKYSFKKRLLIIIIGGIIISCLYFFTIYYQKKTLIENITKIETACENNNFEEGLQLTEQLPDSYKNFYSHIINKKLELLDWNGTEEDLCEWGKEYFFDVLLDVEHVPRECQTYWIWEGGKSSFNSYLKWKDWYSEYYSIYKTFTCRYLTLRVKDAKLFENKTNMSTIILSKDNKSALDSEMEILYQETMENLNRVKEKYGDIEEYDVEDVEAFEELVQKCMESYNSLDTNQLYDSYTSDPIYITAESADRSYEYLCKRIALDVYNMETYDYFSEGQYGQYVSDIIINSEEISLSAIKLGDILEGICPTKISIQDPDYTDITEEWEKIIIDEREFLKNRTGA